MPSSTRPSPSPANASLDHMQSRFALADEASMIPILSLGDERVLLRCDDEWEQGRAPPEGTSASPLSPIPFVLAQPPTLTISSPIFPFFSMPWLNKQRMAREDGESRVLWLSSPTITTTTLGGLVFLAKRSQPRSSSLPPALPRLLSSLAVSYPPAQPCDLPLQATLQCRRLP